MIGNTDSALMINNEDDEDIDDSNDHGIIPRVIHQVFKFIQNKIEYQKTDHEVNTKVITNLRVSFIEIYNEDFKDLLHPDILSRDILIREDKDGRIFFTGTT